MTANLILLSLLLWAVSSFALNSDLQEKARNLLANPDRVVDLYSKHSKNRNLVVKTELESLLDAIHTDTLASAEKNTPRHIFYTLSDDQGFADIGYNDESFVTPTLDFFAGKGMKFDNFYVHATCTPTRASLITGRYAIKTGLQDAPIVPGEARGLPLNLKTMPEYFKGGGYRTMLVGKWHLGHELLANTPNHRGYDYFFGNVGGAVNHYSKDIGVGCGSEENGYQDIFADNCRFFNGYDLQENGVPHIDQTNYSTDILASKSVSAILAHNASQPLMFEFHPTVPHTPVLARQEYVDMCGDGVSAGPAVAYQTYFRPKICGMIVSLDIAVLNIVLALYVQNMLSTTLMVFHSDNGGLEVAGSSNAPYREGKGSLYEGGIHVPAFMYGHGIQSSYSRIPHRKDLMHVSDMLPTLLGYADIHVPKEVSHFDGYNHWDNLVLGRNLKRKHVPINAASIAVGLYSGYIQKLYGQTWKYMFNPNVLIWSGTHRAASSGQRYKIEGEFLYNLDEDPYETTNLIPYVDHFEHTDMHLVQVLNLIRFELIGFRSTGISSSLKGIPPELRAPPSPLGCYLPLDSPLYNTFHCPVPTPFSPPDVFKNYNLTAIAQNMPTHESEDESYYHGLVSVDGPDAKEVVEVAV